MGDGQQLCTLVSRYPSTVCPAEIPPWWGRVFCHHLPLPKANLGRLAPHPTLPTRSGRLVRQITAPSGSRCYPKAVLSSPVANQAPSPIPNQHSPDCFNINRTPSLTQDPRLVAFFEPYST